MLAQSYRFGWKMCWLMAVAVLVFASVPTRAESAGPSSAQATSTENPDAAPAKPQDLDLRSLFCAGGMVGMIIIALSVAMVALIVEHLLSIRRSALMPDGLAEEVHKLVLQNQFREAEEVCRQHPSFLSHVLANGINEAELDYAAVEKAMEDAATEQAARLFRKIEFLNVIGTLAPMLGLMGTVWGMIQAFHTFQLSANPQVSELAPKISTALVTTLLGLMVAVPCLGLLRCSAIELMNWSPSLRCWPSTFSRTTGGTSSSERKPPPAKKTPRRNQVGQRTTMTLAAES